MLRVIRVGDFGVMVGVLGEGDSHSSRRVLWCCGDEKYTPSLSDGLLLVFPLVLESSGVVVTSISRD